MTRVFIVVEGQTEEKVVKVLLDPHLAAIGVFVFPIIVATSRERGSGRKNKGGNGWSHWRNDLLQLSRQHHGADVRITTLLDLYGLDSDFPEYAKLPADVDTVARAERLEAAMKKAVDDRRFMPYIQRHEVEALVLVDLDPLADIVEAGNGVAALRADIAGLEPEAVNEGPETAPSKRLKRFVPEYRKTLHGPLVLEAIGLPRLRAACPRFDRWVASLEALASPPALPLSISGAAE